CTSRPRYAALRPHEAGWPARSPDRSAAVCGGAITPRKSACRFLQPRRLSESFAIRRTVTRVEDDSGTGECALSSLRANPPEHVHQRADVTSGDLADEAISQHFFCGTNLRS